MSARPGRVGRLWSWGSAVALLLPAALVAQTPPHATHDGDGVRLHDESVLGSYVWEITPAAPDAQRYFDQGVRLMFAFTPRDARAAFEEARRLDPECAMCWWGEAWSLGPYLNGAMRVEDAPVAHAAVTRAASLSENATPLEQSLIGALAERYAPAHPADGRASLDSAYVNAMAGVYEAYPASAEVATLYADALMLLEPRRGTWPLSKPSVSLIHSLLEEVLADDIEHPGACHLYIHATETTPKAGEAQACANLLMTSMPGASHLNHMPSHTYNRVGRWGDATASNILAVQSDVRAGRGEAFAIYPLHNQHMLLFSASVDGQSAIAMQAAKDHRKMSPANGESFEALVMVRFGRFDEVLELERAPEHPIHRGVWEFAHGLAHLRMGDAERAADHLSRVDSLAEHTSPEARLRQHSAADLLGVVGNVLRGEMLRHAGDLSAAERAYVAAERLEAGLVYDEPEPLPFLVGDYLGAHLLDRGWAAEAEAVYRRSLEKRPHNGWSLRGLANALAAQGKGEEAAEVEERFRKAWERSEVWIDASRF